MGKTFKAIVNAIKRAEKRGVTRYQISRVSGVSQASLSRMINGGKSDITTGTADRLLDAIELELDIKEKP